MDKYANTTGGTAPIILDETRKSGKLKKGDIVLLLPWEVVDVWCSIDEMGALI